MDFVWEWAPAINRLFGVVILMKGEKYSRQNSPQGSDIWTVTDVCLVSPEAHFAVETQNMD